MKGRRSILLALPFLLGLLLRLETHFLELGVEVGLHAGKLFMSTRRCHVV